jgi:hypothetical protein
MIFDTYPVIFDYDELPDELLKENYKNDWYESEYDFKIGYDKNHNKDDVIKSSDFHHNLFTIANGGCSNNVYINLLDGSIWGTDSSEIYGKDYPSFDDLLIEKCKLKIKNKNNYNDDD